MRPNYQQTLEERVKSVDDCELLQDIEEIHDALLVDELTSLVRERLEIAHTVAINEAAARRLLGLSI